jgi:hypothetical protein
VESVHSTFGATIISVAGLRKRVAGFAGWDYGAPAAVPLLPAKIIYAEDTAALRNGIRSPNQPHGGNHIRVSVRLLHSSPGG